MKSSGWKRLAAAGVSMAWALTMPAAALGEKASAVGAAGQGADPLVTLGLVAAATAASLGALALTRRQSR